MTASRSGEGLYKAKAIVTQYATMGLNADTSSQVTLNVWDKRFGHVNQQTVRRRANNIGIVGMEITPGSESMDKCCHDCEVGKMHKLPFANSTTKFSTFGECVVDLVELLRFDGGTEFITSLMTTILTWLGIKIQTNAPYTPEQTGVIHSTVPKRIEEPLQN